MSDAQKTLKGSALTSALVAAVSDVKVTSAKTPGARTTALVTAVRKVGNVSDVDLMKRMAHLSEGTRELSGLELEIPAGAQNYAARKVATETPDLTGALQTSVAAVEAAKAKAAPTKPLSKAARARALVDEGLATSLADAKRQLADLGE
jgi:hypothetical protein